MVIGLYDEEIFYLDEADPMIDILKPKQISEANSTKTTYTEAETEISGNPSNTFTQPPIFGGLDNDSVLTIGNSVHQKWTPHACTPIPLTQRPTPNKMPTDDKSTSSISTLTTRLITAIMEVQYQQITGDVQDIKNLLAVLSRSSNQHLVQDEAKACSL